MPHRFISLEEQMADSLNKVAELLSPMISQPVETDNNLPDDVVLVESYSLWQLFMAHDYLVNMPKVWSASGATRDLEVKFQYLTKRMRLIAEKTQFKVAITKAQIDDLYEDSREPPAPKTPQQPITHPGRDNRLEETMLSLMRRVAKSSYTEAELEQAAKEIAGEIRDKYES